MTRTFRALTIFTVLIGGCEADDEAAHLEANEAPAPAPADAPGSRLQERSEPEHPDELVSTPEEQAPRCDITCNTDLDCSDFENMECSSGCCRKKSLDETLN